MGRQAEFEFVSYFSDVKSDMQRNMVTWSPFMLSIQNNGLWYALAYFFAEGT